MSKGEGTAKSKDAVTSSATAGDPIMLYNTEEVAERIGVSREQIAELCNEGKAPRHYLTGDVIEIYFDTDSMEELRTLLRADSAPDATP